MSRTARGWTGASAILLGAAGASIAIGALAAACALPGYSLGGSGTEGAGGAGGTMASISASATGGDGGQTAGGGGMAGVGGGGGSDIAACGDTPCPNDPDKPCMKPFCNPSTNMCDLKAHTGPYPKDDKLNPPGDCALAVCKNGVLKYETDITDKHDDKNPCTKNECFASAIDHTPIQLPAGTSCSGDPSAVNTCNANGDCVECVSGSATCAGSCMNENCISNTCETNNTKDGTETDIDCGGSCAPCVENKKCVDGSDCISGVCAGTCQLPTHSDNVRNLGETDVDCGGGNAKPCRVGSRCAMGTDCETLLCEVDTCQFSCANGVKDGTETDKADCGGLCPKCP